MGMKWENWAETVANDNLVKIYKPREYKELSANVTEAAGKQWKLRAVGSGHAWSNLGAPADGTGAVVDLSHLTQVMDTHPGSGTITVMGGATVEDFTEWLFQKGLALANLGDSNPQTVAGAISTETHGSGLSLGSMSEQVAGMRIVRADGSWDWLTPDELKAGRVSLGKLGVIYLVKFRVMESYYLHHYQKLVDFTKEDLSTVKQLLGEYRHLEYWYYPYTDYAERITRKISDTEEIKDPVDPLEEWFIKVMTDFIEFKGKVRPEALPELLKSQVRPGNDLFKDDFVRIGPWHKMLLGKSNVWREAVKTYTMEYQFGLDKLHEAFSQLRESIRIAELKGVYVAAPVQVRFTKKSTSLKSNLIHDPTVSFSISFFRTHKGAHTWLPEVEQRLRDLGGRPHWGKMYYQKPDVTPNDEEFERIRSEFDPDGVFNYEQKSYEPDAEAFQQPGTDGRVSVHQPEQPMPRTHPVILVPGIARFDVLSNGLLKTDNDAKDDAIHYFRNIRTHLQAQGFDVYHAHLTWAGSLETRARDLEREVQNVLDTFQADKVHIIGHSMGGLDARRMLYDFRSQGLPEKVATLTTIGTPHHGSSFADYLVERIGHMEAYVDALGFSIAGLRDLTRAATGRLNDEIGAWEESQQEVRFRAYAGMQEPLHIFTPLKFSWSIIFPEEGENDGFVSVSSQKWTDSYFTAPVLNLDHLNQVGWWDISEGWQGVSPDDLEGSVKRLYLEACEDLARQFPLG